MAAQAVYTTHSQDETAAIGRRLAPTLGPGAIVLLEGSLGAGKTAFVRGLAHGMGVDPGEVTSPTFTLIQEYRGGRLPLYHVDLYRLESIEIDELGLDEIIAGRGVTAIEWPDRLSQPPDGAIRVRLVYDDETTRTVTVEGVGLTPTDSSAPLL